MEICSAILELFCADGWSGLSGALHRWAHTKTTIIKCVSIWSEITKRRRGVGNEERHDVYHTVVSSNKYLSPQSKYSQ
jgi:hypothetical protein